MLIVWREIKYSENITFIFFRSFAGQFLCSYSTLPLYALVTQVI